MTSVFDRIPGQQRVREILERAVESPGDSYLFVGPRGVGKSEAARAFAAAILCPDSCGECSLCSRTIRGIHPDVQIFQPEGYVYPLELIRELVVSARLTPLEAEKRVIVIEEADRIVERSQNALLKALEEPTGAVTWILVADALDPFLPTVLSRCQIVEFVPVNEEAVAALVASRFKLDDEVSKQTVRASRGDLEKALALAEGGDAARVRSLAIDAAIALGEEPGAALDFSTRLQEVVASARDSLADRQKAELEQMEEIIGSGRGSAATKKRAGDRHKRMLRRTETDLYLDFVTYLGTALRDLAFVSSGGDPESVVCIDHAQAIVAAAGNRPTQHWLELIDECLACHLSIIENANAPLAVESVLLALSKSPVATIG